MVFSFLAQTDPLQGLRSFFLRITDRPWVTLAELLLIGTVVYSLLRSLEGTRGARLARAVFTILGVSFAVVWLLAERFGLERINALYPYFILGIFLVSLVAFQTELRRMLLRVGEGIWLQRWIHTSTELIDPIVVAAEHLARKKIGALIAVENSVETGGIYESGVPIDAKLTAELLETIFWPGSTLHDLGVLVHGGRIRAAGCQFPLSESEDIDRELGSRHRAALGLSQDADVVVVVVSEETGTISVARHGKLIRHLTPESLAVILRRELGLAETKRRRRFRHWRTRDKKFAESRRELVSSGNKVTNDGTN
ncbi:MAG: diadenylate cyclase [Planctomycetes bacterium]|nr:diadenylate cyclase [Planctomycetota bacterium]